jgi:hypothetical protein
MIKLNISRKKVTGRVLGKSSSDTSGKISDRVINKIAEIKENAVENTIPDVLTGTVTVEKGISFSVPVTITLRSSVYNQAGRYTIFTWGEGYSFTGARNLKFVAPAGFFVSRVLLNPTARTFTVDLAQYNGK